MDARKLRQDFVCYLLLMKGDRKGFIEAYDRHGGYGDTFTGDGTIYGLVDLCKKSCFIHRFPFPVIDRSAIRRMALHVITDV